MDTQRLQKQVPVLLRARGFIADSEPLAEFIKEDRHGHTKLFPTNKLPEGDLLFGAGCLNDDDTEVFAGV